MTVSGPCRTRIHWLGVALIIGLSIGGCHASAADGSGSGSLFGRDNNPKIVTVVHPEVGATLQRAAVFPGQPSPVSTTTLGTVSEVAVAGRPPEAHFAASVVPGAATSAYLVEGVAGQPRLVLVNMSTAPMEFEIWELAAAAKDAFARQRKFEMAAEPGQWIARRVAGVASLPGHRLFVAVRYLGSKLRNAAYLYDIDRNLMIRVGAIEPDTSDPDQYFETRLVGADALLVRFDSDNVRLAAERYANTRNHLVLYSRRFADGLEVLNLGIDDGSIRRWTVAGKTLWLETADPRQSGQQPAAILSLDLSKVL